MFESNAFLREQGCQQAHGDTPTAPAGTLEKATSIWLIFFCHHTPPQARLQIPDLNMMDSFQLNLSAYDERFGGVFKQPDQRVSVLHTTEGSFTEHPLSHPILLEEAEPLSCVFSNSNTFRPRKFSQ